MFYNKLEEYWTRKLNIHTVSKMLFNINTLYLHVLNTKNNSFLFRKTTKQRGFSYKMHFVLFSMHIMIQADNWYAVHFLKEILVFSTLIVILKFLLPILFWEKFTKKSSNTSLWDFCQFIVFIMIKPVILLIINWPAKQVSQDSIFKNMN